MVRTSTRTDDWLAQTVEGLMLSGCAIVEDVLAPQLCDETKGAMYEVQARIHERIGEGRLGEAGELGVLRLMLAFDDFFARLLEVPALLAVVDATVSETCVLHLQNGLILPSFPVGEVPTTFQTSYHRDFPRYLNGYLASVNCFFAIDEFTATNGGTVLVPGTHQLATQPTRAYLDAHAVSVECPAGSMLTFDSTLWHAAGANTSGRDRLAINHQFTRSLFKQQIDYVRALGPDMVLAQKPRTQQLLGWYTRVATSLEEYYRPQDQRLYRAGQG